MVLDDKERLRYSRHILLKEVGEKGQIKLKKAHIAVIGCGGLGSPALFYLAASGVGELTLVDNDEVELSNLQRQILYKVNHIGQQKVNAAGKVLASLNNQIALNPICVELKGDNIDTVLSAADIILDCSDNFATRYLLNQYCLMHKKVLISGAAIATTGQVMCFDFRYDSPCYACVFAPTQHSDKGNCDTFGVISPLLGVVGAQQALLALNISLGHHSGCYFASIDALTLKQSTWRLVKDSSCMVCAE
ncbi:Molybdopterin-synthase adenylyltransferase [Pseudoalteromonas sp. CIP111854]|uniref:Molybdopterin-synthase adenylyltransferase n=1 Tax=Pseudoalteromonas holothuriae TaxID=2963714 RepID=A0A9W4QVL3_9GAMM|nr:HesA/MoeB/ThiF family protein [Pseudoalteromonas sp. CIP111854]CAH9054961.1 Molybdopterin-synthase adenylyltransferase [Pseudoalteromonas sp. CIP111854]